MFKMNQFLGPKELEDLGVKADQYPVRITNYSDIKTQETDSYLSALSNLVAPVNPKVSKQIQAFLMSGGSQGTKTFESEFKYIKKHIGHSQFISVIEEYHSKSIPFTSGIWEESRPVKGLVEDSFIEYESKETGSVKIPVYRYGHGETYYLPFYPKRPELGGIFLGKLDLSVLIQNENIV